MSYGDQAAAPGLNGRGERLERLWPDNDVSAAEDGVADLAAGLTNVGFIRAALRRSRWFWACMAVAGLIIGSGLDLSSPPLYQASTTLLLTVGPEGQPGTAILDNQAIAESRAVATLALQQLGSRQDVGSFLGSYTATVVTDRVLRITVSASSSGVAVRTANAVAAAFLQFRADQLQEQQQLQFAALDQQVTQDQRHLKSITDQISQLSGQAGSASDQAQLSLLRTQRDAADNALTALKETVNGEKATSQITTASMITGSKVIDAASPLAHSRFKVLILYAAAGLIIGLTLGVSILVVRALTSDRPYRRDDVARALGAPVRLSIPAKPSIRRLSALRGRAAHGTRDVQRIVAYLRDAVRTNPRGVTAVAVVAVDDPRVAARSLVSLAESCAQQGSRVVVADLCGGSPAARLLGVKDPGVQLVSLDGTRLIAAIPDPEEVTPVGPLGAASPRTQSTIADQIAAACASADLLLTLVVLDPAVGADHLRTWATDAFVVITAGRPSWSKIQAVGEMTRLAGTHLVSAILVGADRADESLGATSTPQAGPDTVAREAPRLDQEGYVATSGQGPGGGPPSDASTSRTRRASHHTVARPDPEGYVATADHGLGGHRPSTTRPHPG